MTMRGIDWAVVTGGSAISAAILAGCVAFASDGPPLGYVRLALVGLAAAAAFVLDGLPPVQSTPCPTPEDAVPPLALPQSHSPLALWVLGVLALELRTAVTPTTALLVEGAGVLAVAVAAAAVLRHVGRAEPGEAGGNCARRRHARRDSIFNPPPRSVPDLPDLRRMACQHHTLGLPGRRRDNPRDCRFHRPVPSSSQPWPAGHLAAHIDALPIAS